MRVTVTVTDALVLRPLVEDRGRITESVRILMPVDRIEQKCFQSTSNAAVLVLSAACSTLVMQRQKKLCRQFVHMSMAQRGCHVTTDEARSVDRPRNSTTGVRRSDMYPGVCPKSEL